MLARNIDRPKIGEPFNPYRGVCGFYPPEVVTRLRRFSVLGTRRIFAHVHKQLFTLLVHRWGKHGPCFPSQQRLADDLGCSLRTVKALLADLEAFGLIRRRQRGRRSCEYEFLWHPIYEYQNPQKKSSQKCKPESAGVQKSAAPECEAARSPHKEETNTVETNTSKPPVGAAEDPAIQRFSAEFAAFAAGGQDSWGRRLIRPCCVTLGPAILIRLARFGIAQKLAPGEVCEVLWGIAERSRDRLGSIRNLDEYLLAAVQREFAAQSRAR